MSNHQSHLDPVLIGVACPRQLGALARKSLFVWPLSWLIRSLGAVPVDRGRRRWRESKPSSTMLRAGDAVIVFPEGTRTYDGKLQPFQVGLLRIARRGGATIVPTTIDGAFAAFPRGALLPRPRPDYSRLRPADHARRNRPTQRRRARPTGCVVDRGRERCRMHFRLLSYNIHKGIGGVDRRYDLERIVETINYYRPDVALLQEVDDGVPRSRRHAQAELLAEATELDALRLPAQRLAQGRPLWQRDSQPFSA